MFLHGAPLQLTPLFFADPRDKTNFRRNVRSSRKAAVRRSGGFRDGGGKGLEEELGGQYECEQVVQLERVWEVIYDHALMTSLPN